MTSRNGRLKWRHKDEKWSKTFIVKPVCDFVTDDDPDAPVVQGLGEVLTVEQGLQNSGRKN